jgi:hypothetical protein
MKAAFIESDVTCCGLTLASLPELLQHFDETHANALAARTSQPPQNGFTSTPQTPPQSDLIRHISSSLPPQRPAQIPRQNSPHISPQISPRLMPRPASKERTIEVLRSEREFPDYDWKSGFEFFISALKEHEERHPQSLNPFKMGDFGSEGSFTRGDP